MSELALVPISLEEVAHLRNEAIAERRRRYAADSLRRLPAEDLLLVTDINRAIRAAASQQQDRAIVYHPCGGLHAKHDEMAGIWYRLREVYNEFDVNMEFFMLEHGCESGRA